MGTSGGAKPITNGGDGARVVPASLDALELLPLWEHPLGEVFAAGDGKSERALQLTVLRTELVRGDQGLRRCIDTNAMLAEMESPYIPALLDARRVADGRVVLAMERLGGMPLGQHMLDGPMPPGRVIAILRQLCRALDVAHAIGVRHGALSVASVILVEHEGRADAVRLVDFGLEDELTVEAMAAHEVETQPLSPEKLGSHVLDSREDVYLLGAVGYAALAGRPLFRGDAAAVREAHERSTPDALDCDAPLAAVILRCLNKEPSKRFPDVRAIDDALQGAQEISGFTTGWDHLRPMGGSNTSGALGKPKTLGLGSIGRIPSGPYGLVPADKAKGPMTTAEKLAEKIKAEKEAKPEGKAAMTPAEKLAEKLKAQRRENAEARLEAEKEKKSAVEQAGGEKLAAEKVELKKIEPEKKLEAPRNISPSASATFDATELIEDVAGLSGAFAAPPPPPKREPSGRHPAVTPVPIPAKTSPIAAPPPATKAKGSGSSGSTFERAAVTSGSSGSSFDRAATVGSSTSGSFDRAATLGLNLGRAGAGAGAGAKIPAAPPVPVVTGKPTPVPKVDSKPISAPVAKVDSKPLPLPLPVPVPKTDSKPTPAVEREPAAPTAEADAAESMTLQAVEEPATAEAKVEADAPKEPVASDVITAPPLSSSGPSDVITMPRTVPEPVRDDAGEKKTPAWLMVAGVALIIGLPVAWLAMREGKAPATAAAESKPKPPEPTPAPEPEPVTKQPEPTPPQPEPTPVVDPVADPDDGGQPVADGGVVPQPEPTPEPVAEPEPKPDGPAGDGGATPAAAPTPQEKARELIRAGDKAYAAGQLGKAETKYKAALAENPRAHAAAAGLGRIAFNKASYSDAATYYGRAVKASGSNGEYRIHYGDALFKLGKYPEAKVQYTKAKSLRNGQADGRLKKVQAKLGS